MNLTPPEDYRIFLAFCSANSIPILTHQEWLWASCPTPQQYRAQAYSAPGLPTDHAWGRLHGPHAQGGSF